jgi:hypothetical protein
MAGRALGYDLVTREPISVSPAGDGVTDDYAVLQDIFTRAGVFTISPGKFYLSRPLVGPKVANVGIIGAGCGYNDPATVNAGTVFIGGFATGTVIQSPGFVSHAQYVGFTVDRSVVATDGYGLDMGASCDEAYLYDLWFLRQKYGFRLGTAGYCKAEYIRSESNVSDGAHITGQWQLENIFCALNGGSGFLCTAALATGNSLGQYKGLSTYSNKNYGIAFLGKVYDIRLSDSFFGSDGSNEIYVANENTGGHNTFTHVMTEDPGGASAWFFAESSYSNGLVGCSNGVGKPHGFVNSAPFLSMLGGGCWGASGYGLLMLAGRATVMGGRFTNNAIGIGCGPGAVGITAIGNDMRNTVTPFDVALVPEAQRVLSGNFTV